MRYLRGEPSPHAKDEPPTYPNVEAPDQFLERTKQDPKKISQEIEDRIAKIGADSIVSANITKYALISFLTYHKTDVRLDLEIKVKRKRRKSELTWSNAERIIAETREPYRGILKFMLLSGLGLGEVWEIQNSKEIQKQIDSQRDSPFVKINLEPRKKTLDEFFTLVPSQFVPQFPIFTKAYSGRQAALLDSHDIESRWNLAARRIELWIPGLGPHTLRSSFRSQCQKSGVIPAVAEFFMGHGGADKYGYAREVLDVQFAAAEIKKLWSFSDPMVAQARSNGRMAELEKELATLKADRESTENAINVMYARFAELDPAGKTLKKVARKLMEDGEKHAPRKKRKR
jgi:integrase